MCASRTSALVAIVDPSPDRYQLRSATLYALGCRILPVVSTGQDLASLRELFTTCAPDVLLWHYGENLDADRGPLLGLLGSGVLDRTGLVITTQAPNAATMDVGEGRASVQVLGTSCTLVELMRAVAAAERSAPGGAAASRA